jgi:hypothetical protein
LHSNLIKRNFALFSSCTIKVEQRYEKPPKSPPAQRAGQARGTLVSNTLKVF